MTLDTRRRAKLVKHSTFRALFERAYQRWEGDPPADPENALERRDRLMGLIVEEMERG